MEELLIAGLLALSVSLVEILGDFFVKIASLQPGFAGWKTWLIGILIYGSTGIIWFFLLRKSKLSTAGVTYSVGVVVFLTLLGVFYFKEKINSMEILAIIMAIASLVILYKFA